MPKSLAEAIAEAVREEREATGEVTSTADPVQWAEAYRTMSIAFKARFRRSRPGNLCCNYGGVRMTVYGRNGLYHWCFDSGDEPRFSRGGYESEGEALDALWEAFTDV